MTAKEILEKRKAVHLGIEALKSTLPADSFNIPTGFNEMKPVYLTGGGELQFGGTLFSAKGARGLAKLILDLFPEDGPQ